MSFSSRGTRHIFSSPQKKKKSSKWLPHSLQGRVARKRYSTVVSSADNSKTPVPRHTFDTFTQQSQLRQSGPNPTSEASTPTPTPSPHYHTPPVLTSSRADNAPHSGHKIHILGHNEQSKYIAHFLSGVHDSVELLGWKERVSTRYKNIETSETPRSRDSFTVQPNRAPPRVFGALGKSPINNLVVTGHGCEAKEALQSVKHRLRDDTNICFMNNGLGVLEDVKQMITKGLLPKSNIMMGHMSHRMCFNVNFDSVKVLRNGITKMTPTGMSKVQLDDDFLIMDYRFEIARSLRKARDFQFSLSNFDNWLRFKLPEVIFNSVVEPVCALLEIRYENVLDNISAKRAMVLLMAEIVTVVQKLPELESSDIIRDFLRGKTLHQLIHSKIMAKAGQPSLLLRRIKSGQPTDIDYANGYFLRRGKALGVDVSMNTLVRDLINAKHMHSLERSEGYVPMEHASQLFGA
ncbi:hypothetical protein CDD82_3999 [Ophiocordyceps australis]|uniref:Ketopantoate reductase C-terminal domain-containing protein n=1 Tax=Ophiocordyceps australis TaxID=1399860 RepID=A0A2C5Z9G2_9HYPO|nr:hypothetical protein CDD82_3999 [Ophiocordyceps australis]